MTKTRRKTKAERYRALREPVDQGTPEISRQHKVIPQRAGPQASAPLHLRVVDESEIDRLLLKDWINVEQHQTAETLLDDLHNAGLIGMRISNYERRMGGGDTQNITRREALRRVKVRKALEYMEAKGGVKAGRLVLGVVMDDTRVVEKDLPSLREGLDFLARFYGEWR